MGIKPSYIKNLSEELLNKHRNKFSKDFDQNKQAVSEVALIDSKRVRNRVAGNITRRVSQKKRY
jgi:small subunit ribosomal protein S17e